MPAPNGPSWRGSGGPPGSNDARSWRRPATDGTAEWPISSKILNSLLGLGSTLVSIAAITLFIYLIFVPGCAHYDVVVMAPAPYHDPGLPPHPFAEQDRNDFTDRFSASSLEERLQAGTNVKLRNRGAWRSVLIVYVTALAGQYVKEQEQTNDREPGKRIDVVLYGIDSGPDEPEGRMSLDRVLKYLEEQPPALKKVLFIDLARGPMDWRWGQFTRPVLAAGLLEQASKKIPNLAIITACAPGEVSWSRPSQGHTAFAHYLMQGLLGDADGKSDRKRDGRVQLDELYSYVLKQTNQWVVQNRHFRGQHPQLFLASDDLNSTVVAEVKKQTASSAASVEPALNSDLLQLWEDRDTWSKAEPEQWCPLEWRQFLEHLHRAEQWWLAGQPDAMQFPLEAARDAVKSIQKLNDKRSSEAREITYVSQNLLRRTGTKPVAVTSPVLPERQLENALGRFAPASLSKDIKLGILTLRSDAETQSWQPFRTRLWTGTRLRDANRQRRLAEDLVFVGGTEELSESASARKTAETALAEHADIVKHVSNAHRLHRRLLAELPELAVWAAQRVPVEDLNSTPGNCRRATLMEKYALGISRELFTPPSLIEQEKSGDDKDDSAPQRMEVDLLLLFQQARELAALLDQELEIDSTRLNQPDWLDQVKSLAQNADRGLESLRGRLRQHGDDLVRRRLPATPGSGQSQYFDWLKQRNALQWSGQSRETRRGLFEALIGTGREVENNAQKQSVAQNDKWNGDDWTSVDGCWYSLWALQALSLGGTDNAMHKRWVIWKSAVLEPDRKLEWLVQLGQSVRTEYQLRVDRAQEPLTVGMDLKQVLRTLLKSERAVRSLHGYDAVRFPAERDPTRRLEEFDAGATCLEQADQYLEDFWGPDYPSQESWYTLAARECLRTARRKADQLAIKALKDRSATIETRLQDLEKNARLSVRIPEPTASFGLKTQLMFRVGATISDQVPPGVAALWMAATEPDPTQPILEIPAARARITAEKRESDMTIGKLRIPPAADCDAVTVRSQLLFRARMWDDERDVVHVNACPPVSVDEEYHPPGDKGEIKVTGFDRRNTIFIMDCSKSMTAEIDPADKTKTRFTVGRSKLCDAIKRLNSSGGKNPYVIGLMAYGHRTDLNPDRTLKPNTNWPTRVVDWRDTELLEKPAALRGNHFDRINAYLDVDANAKVAGVPLLEPFGITPSLGAIKQAAQELIKLGQGGVIVLICDGSYSDEEMLPEVTTLLQRNPNLSLQIVAYGVQNKKELDELTKLAEDTKGKVFPALDGNKLADVISSLMKPRPYAVIREAPPRQEPQAELNFPVEPLAPHAYKVHFPGLPDVPVTIYGGERLEFELDLVRGRLVHQRPKPKLFRRAQGTSPFSLTEPNRFGYLKAKHNKAPKAPVAEFQFCLDRDDLLDTIIDRPAEVRLWVTPQGDNRRLSRSWGLLPNASIPVWKVTVKDWPANGKPVVQTRWKMTRTEPDKQLSIRPGPSRVNLPEWPEIEVWTESLPGQLLVKLNVLQAAGKSSLTDIRVELGRQSQIQSRFLPVEYHRTSSFYEKEQTITYAFDVGESFDPAVMLVALTSAATLDQGSRMLTAPLEIEKWDDE